MPQQQTKVELLIIGGGIGGMATALAIARSGRRVHLIERAPEFGEIGAGLQMGPNAMQALEELGVLAAVEAAAVIPTKMSLVDIYTGELIKAVDTGPAFVRRFGYKYLLLHRSDLLQILIDACRETGLVTLEPGKDVVEVVDCGRGAEVKCADGSHYACEGLIAADGLWSVVRRTFFSDAAAEPNRYVVYRGMASELAQLPHSGPTDLVYWVGQELHLTQYPLRHQKLLNQVACFKSYRFTPDSDDWGTAEELEERFADCHPQVRNALNSLGKDRRWPLVDRAPIIKWAQNSIVLTGDAAHPMLQYLAQGACQALEDAVYMARMIGAHDSFERAFIAFQNGRFVRTATVQTIARYAEHFWHPGGLRAEARNTYLKNQAPTDYEDMAWLYDRRAIDIMNAPTPRLQPAQRQSPERVA